MKATVTKAFPGVPDGQTQVKQFAVGEAVEGTLASVAIAEGWAIPAGNPADAEGAPASVARRILLALATALERAAQLLRRLATN